MQKNGGLLYCFAEANSQYQVDTVKATLEEMGYTCGYYAFSDSNDLATITLLTQRATVMWIYIPTDNTAARKRRDHQQYLASLQRFLWIAGEEGICSGRGVATLPSATMIWVCNWQDGS